MERVHERVIQRPESTEPAAPIGGPTRTASGTTAGTATMIADGALMGRPFAWLSGISSWRVVRWWATAILALSAVMLLFYTCPAYAQAGDIDTCAGGDGVGGEGGQAILNAIKNLALFGAAAIGGLSVLGLLASGAAIILGSASKDWQRRGAAGLGYAFLGIVIALGAAAIYGVFEWAICG